ncbi:hypothetical protein [Leisingera sp. M658]|uniref:hypothetical protein n=1 Tax=Leisingera sp. M658 TaxID=2867015 RepID=UPI0021A7CE26|nr:hypothetical protein [Leisingera sp. M658]UWQ76046.1 hypothetical protein K3724_06305 [Leisingera sp. M658]
MSDPVTHAEIEDVLSSIRRLVSDDSRSGPAAPEPAARLVLTPALRVQEDGPDCPPVTDPATAEPKAVVSGDPEQVGGTAPDLEAEAPIAFRHRNSVAEIASPLDDWQAEAEQDTGLQAVQPEPGQLDTGCLEADRLDADHLNSDPDAGSEHQKPQDTPGAVTDAPWGDPNATLFAAAADAEQPADATGNLDAETPADSQAPEDSQALQDSQVIETAGARAASVVRKIAELEARSARGQAQEPQQWEPDSQTEAPFASTVTDTIEWRDEPLSARRAAPQDEDGASAAADTPRDAGAEVLPGPGVNDGSAVAKAETLAEAAMAGAALETLAEAGDGYLDEDSLRDLVASIVREELQGPLGERITRNVRKLVRREIHRALAAHDLL